MYDENKKVFFSSVYPFLSFSFVFFFFEHDMWIYIYMLEKLCREQVFIFYRSSNRIRSVKVKSLEIIYNPHLVYDRRMISILLHFGAENRLLPPDDDGESRGSWCH